MTPNEIQSILQKQFPDSTIQYAGEGWTSIAFCVNNKIIRVPKTGIEKYKKEAKVLQFLYGKLSVPIPQPQVIEGDLTYAVHIKIEGLSWDLNTFTNLPESAQNDFCRDVATFFYELHQIPLDDLMTVIPQQELQMSALLDRKTIHSYLQDEFSSVEIDKLYDFSSNTLIPQSDFVLLHKDFQPNNSLVNEHHRLSGVFDFANSGIGERAIDFRALYDYKYIPILKKILCFYNEMTGTHIELSRIRDLKNADCLFCIQYLGKNPHLKETMPYEWKMQIEHAQRVLKEL